MRSTIKVPKGCRLHKNNDYYCNNINYKTQMKYQAVNYVYSVFIFYNLLISVISKIQINFCSKQL